MKLQNANVIYDADNKDRIQELLNQGFKEVKADKKAELPKEKDEKKADKKDNK